MKSTAPISGALWTGLLLAFAAHADSKSMDDVVNPPLIANSPTGASMSAPPCKQPSSGRSLVQTKIIPAEIISAPGKANAAASALQRLGFRVRHIGETVSVEGPETLWASVFNISFETCKKRVLSEVKGGDVTYRRANTEKLKIPAELEQLIADVAFVEPPEFY
jgi:hypothetical protein